MPIDRLSSTNPLIAALRSELRRKAGTAADSDVPEVETASASTADRPDVAALRRDIAAILKDIDPADKVAIDAVRPRMIRAILLWEFGSQLREHNQWQSMIDTLAQALEDDEGHRLAMERLIAELRD